MPDATFDPTRAYLVQLPCRLVAEIDHWRIDRGMSRARAIALLLREALDAQLRARTCEEDTHACALNQDFDGVCGVCGSVYGKLACGACADGWHNSEDHACALGDNGGWGAA